MRASLTPAAVIAAAAALTAVPSAADPPAPDKFDDSGFVSIFNGKDLTGWSVSAETGHSRTSGNTSGGKWEVVDGAIVGSQDVPGNGGILITDKQYGDFEVALEMRNDDGPDSGLFLRSTRDGTTYQAMIDYHQGGNLMGIYGEGRLGGKPHVQNFDFGRDVTEIVVPSTRPDAGFKCPVAPADWKAFWDPSAWNEVRARITGNPPTITTWVKGVKFMHYVEPGPKRHPDAGGIALQVHGGGDYTRQFVRYRNIRVKDLR